MAEEEKKAKKKEEKTPEQKLEEINKKLATIEEAITKTGEKLKELRLKKLNLIEKADKIKAGK